MAEAGRARWRRRAAAALAAALAVVAGCSAPADGPGPAPGPPAAGSPAVGVQFHGVWDDYTDAEREEVLDRLAEAGVRWIRLDLSWAMLQPEGPGTRSERGVALADRLVDMAGERGLRVLAMFWLTPAWANGGAGERALPDDPGDYARAIGWAARRWAGRVAAWEVWNEPNDARFLVGADPVRYAALLRAAHPAVKAGDPDAVVVFGGTAYNDAEWIERAYAAGAGGSFDVLATHPYPGVADLGPEAPDDGTRYRLTAVTRVREVMVEHGDADVPVWFTEVGWSSHDRTGPGVANGARGVSRQTQADHLAGTLRLVAERYDYVTHVFWYRERDADTGDLQNDNYGLLDRELRPKPAWERLRRELGPPG